ncbi:phosphate ABC transporter substrate-binding protein, PhoT family [Pseudooceanicola antarcticus]|uniref:Cell envelope biogenesis protein OmpA n=1 Tax=Pseudooceanicola antarcticus TaxID=1247613 RepID=A0A285HRV2_9RHOB|nr:phosphate ABC transporter substrate-binding/OmpA family protein [Pseudooceanicola antarcticus]PJE27613.1 cell envelope biogenesis protein OmpA [Pseudooceanicola antarcticus]SNY38438.1 phosphate ABC transporter substrate-binding protein, PhoT family [Pseudooceanicola antarcticus]
MRVIRAAFCAALFLLCPALAVKAQDVTLTSRDGAVELSGDLLGFDGEFYRLQTEFGVLTLDGSGVLCAGPGCPDLTDFVARITISGAETVGEILMPALVEGFALRAGLGVTREQVAAGQVLYTLSERDTGRVAGEFTIHSHTTDRGFEELIADGADLVMALREVREAELTAAREAGLGDLTQRGRARVLALDALVPIVAPGNPVQSITMPELAKVYAGEIDNWQDLGGADAPIVPHLRRMSSGLGQVVQDRLLAPVEVTLAETAVEHDSDEALLQAVLSDPFAIGLSSASEVGSAAGLALSGECGFTLQATRRNAKTEDYPMTAPVFLYQPAVRLPKLARDFLAYTRDPQAQYVIRRAGFVDQLPEEVAIDDQGDRFANAIAQAGEETPLAELQRMIGTLTGMKRLTTSFRFRAGSTRLDAQSLSNVRLLAGALESGQYDGRQILLVGFSDGEGGAEANRAISARRAETVRRAILAAAETADLSRIELGTDAFGEAMPMACDDSEWGRRVNRRVEVWLR